MGENWAPPNTQKAIAPFETSSWVGPSLFQPPSPDQLCEKEISSKTSVAKESIEEIIS